MGRFPTDAAASMGDERVKLFTRSYTLSHPSHSFSGIKSVHSSPLLNQKVSASSLTMEMDAVTFALRWIASLRLKAPQETIAWPHMASSSQIQ